MGFEKKQKMVRNRPSQQVLHLRVDQTYWVIWSRDSAAEPGPKLRTPWYPSQAKVGQDGFWVLLKPGPLASFPWEVHAH